MSRTQSGTKAAPPLASRSGTDAFELSRFVVPLPPKGIVRRARLLERLDLGARGPLTLVTAPAGTGKTVLVSSWAAAARAVGTVVWLSLDADVSTGSFWHLVATGMSRRGVDVPAPVTAAEPDAGDPSYTATIAGRILAHHEPVVLILDCDGALESAVGTKLDSLIHRSAGNLRVVLVTREDPLLPLHRYRLAETVVEVRMADLAFTVPEARELLTGTGVNLSEVGMDAVTSRTQGWAAGLRMAAMSLAHRTDREDAARELAGNSGTVAEYLLAEVLDTQPQGLRRLLLETSVVDVLRPGLAAALAGPHAERALSFLVHGNAFLEELPELPGCYRYHLLFRELLRAQLAYEDPARSVELHRVAATWLADHGLVVDAVRHATAIGDWETAARYVVDDLSLPLLLTAPATDPLVEALAPMPKKAAGTAGTLVAAARAAAGDDWRGVAAGIRRARQAIADDEPWPAAELDVSLLELALARRAGDAVAALDAATAAQALVHRQSPVALAAHPELDAVIATGLGEALVLAGRLSAAAEAFSVASETGHVAGREQPLIDALGHRALLSALRGELRAAAELAGRVVRISSAAGLTPARCPAAAEVALAYVHTETYDIAGARRHVARAATCGATATEPLSAAMLGLVLARISRAGGDLDGALAVLDETVARAGLPVWLADRLVLEQVTLLVVDGQSDRAADLAAQLSEPRSREAGMLRAGAPAVSVGAVVDPAVVTLRGASASLAVRVDTMLQEAAGHLAAGNARRAVRELEHALRLAAPEQLRRPFREAPEELWRLLRQHDELLQRHQWLTNRQAGRPTGPVSRPRRGGAGETTPTSGQILEPLTDKEREVLGHLSELLTTDEIAAVMFISVNTVRTHVRNILRKLSASRRNEAVRRARELRIIST